MDSNRLFDFYGKVEYIAPMDFVSMLPHAEFEPCDHRKDAPRFIASLTGKMAENGTSKGNLKIRSLMLIIYFNHW